MATLSEMQQKSVFVYSAASCFNEEVNNRPFFHHAISNSDQLKTDLPTKNPENCCQC